jgi:predicted cupin superfamily sugar epimerase
MSSSAAPLTAARVIELLRLEPLPEEGGFFRQVWCSAARIPPDGVPWKVRYGRPFGTAIHYLMEGEGYSALHRLQGDELYFHQMGDPVEQLLLKPDGSHERRLLGQDLARGELLVSHVPGGWWQGSRPKGTLGWSLVACTMAPGWDHADFELGRRAALRRAYPECAADVTRFTRA